MNEISILESGMSFGPFPDDRVFYIEKSELYKSLGDGVPIAEFLLLYSRNNKPDVVWVIEAKSSTPNPQNQTNFNDFIAEIRDKLANALSLGLAGCLKRHPDAILPVAFQNLDLSVTDFRLILVVNGHKEEWLPPLQEELSISLRAIVKTWALSPSAVAVINDQLARNKYNLIS